MQCTSYYRDPYEHAAWQLYLRECALRAAREEVAFLEATGGATGEELARIRERVLAGKADETPTAAVVKVKEEEMDDLGAMANNNTRLLNIVNHHMNNNNRSDDDVVVLSPTPPPASFRSRTVSLKSVLADVAPDLPEREATLNALCRRVRPLLERRGITTFKKHQTVHVLRSDAQRVLDLSAGLVF
jgi:hypothetical protein